jgi:hypothetical protein
MGETEFERAVETSTGRTVEEIRRTPLEKLPKPVKGRKGPPQPVTQTISHQEIERKLDEALK